MSYGLIAFLDDIAALAKMAAASVDDIAAQSLKAGSSSLGIVIDDAAVTPRYVTDISPARELPAIFRIARWSLFNKIVIILPSALLLAQFAPWIITPILTLGGLYLAFEGAEKVLELLGLHKEHHAKVDPDAPKLSPEELETQTIRGAIQTDFILSAEIMVLTLSQVATEPFGIQLGVLFSIAIVFTLGVYGVVALIVRADDFGLRLAQRHPDKLAGRLGATLVRNVPGFLKILGIIGTIAMLWVGGSLLVHGLAYFHVEWPEHLIHDWAHAAAEQANAAQGAIEWLVKAAMDAMVALVIGSLIAFGISLVTKDAH